MYTSKRENLFWEILGYRLNREFASRLKDWMFERMVRLTMIGSDLICTVLEWLPLRLII